MDKYIFKKKYGQNFIKDENLLRKIVNFISISKEDLVLEIGLGQGDLSKIILENNPFFLGYEIDIDLKKYLDKYISSKSIIIYENFLKEDIKSRIDSIKYNKLFVIANLPYYITTPIIKKIINDDLNVDQMLLMVQKEVGERITAQPNSKEYGSLTVYLNYYFNINKVLNIDKNNFVPRPNVDSVVLLFEKKNEKQEALNFKHFEKLILDSFQHKRKIIKNNLVNYNLTIVEKILLQNNFNLNSRAEQIPLDVFIELSNALYNS